MQYEQLKFAVLLRGRERRIGFRLDVRLATLGNKFARITLLKCTLGATRYWSYLKAFHRRTKERNGPATAITAATRKPLITTCNTLKNKRGVAGLPALRFRQPSKPAGQTA